MVFIKKNWILSTNNYIIKKYHKSGIEFIVDVWELKENKKHELAKFDNEKQQEELFNKILQAIYNDSHYVNI